MRRVKRTVIVLVALAATLGIAACGAEEDELEREEGQPVTLGELRYNVLFTRFLNPDDVEDRGFLVGQDQPPTDQVFLGVFMRIENDADDATRIADEFKVLDFEGNEYEPLPTESPFALELGSRIEGDGELPRAQSVADTGTIQGSMLLFLVDRGITENRPVELEIPAESGEDGLIELDI